MASQPPYPARWTWPAYDPDLPKRLRAVAAHGSARGGQPPPAGSTRRWLYGASPSARRTVIGCWAVAFAALVAALVTSAPGLGGGTDLPLAMWLTCSAAAATSTVAWRQLSPERELSKSRSQVITPNQVDGPSRLLLARAQQAIDYVVGSSVSTAGLLDHTADQVTLQRHEWEIACALRDISALRDRFNADASASLGGQMTTAVLESQRRAIALAQDATQSRIEALERYAAQVRAADVAHQDWQTAQRLAGNNDMYLELVARTAADGRAVAEIDGMIAHATAAAEVLRESLHRASLAAEVLALPTPITPALAAEDAPGQPG